jgi:hypothetical protein
MSEQNPAEPSVPPVPRYGEYAPGHPAAPSTAGQPPVAPTPGYGQPPAVGQAPAAPPASAPPPGYYYAPVPTGPRRRTWDVVLTIVLLVLGLIGLTLGLAYAAILSTPDLLSEALSQQGYGEWNGDAGSAPAVIVISHVVLFLLAAALSILLLVKRRIAFYVPLSAGVLATIIFWVAFTGAILSDPNALDNFS